MLTVKMQIQTKPQLRNPTMICGLPGSGLVGKLAVDYVIKELGAEPVGLIYSYSLPPQVYVRSDGLGELVRHEIYSSRLADKESGDLLLYTGDSQPITAEAEFELADEVLDLAAELGVKKVYTLAAYITGQFVPKPRVYGTSTDKAVLEELRFNEVTLMNEGNITGMNGILIGMSKLKGMEGICLLGETSGYIVDAKASQAVLAVLSRMVGVKVDMAKLEERARQTELFVRQMEEMARGGVQRQERPSGREFGYIS